MNKQQYRNLQEWETNELEKIRDNLYKNAEIEWVDEIEVYQLEIEMFKEERKKRLLEILSITPSKEDD